MSHLHPPSTQENVQKSTSVPPSLLIVAGEASADLHGADVIKALLAKAPQIKVFGIGGSHMRALGLEPVARAEDISIAGLTEVLFAIPRILGIMRRLVRVAEEKRPSVAILIDLPDFNLRLARKLRALQIPVLYYISPQVWAWRQKRVHAIKRLVDRMLVILPFEREFYARYNVPVDFVGHPLVDELADAPTRAAARQTLGLSQTDPVVAILPGSRKKEITRHLPDMLNALQTLRQSMAHIRAVLPIAPTISRALIESYVKGHAAADRITLVDAESTTALVASDTAMVCSGTATLQTALLNRPMVVVYRVSWLTYHILKRMVRVAHIALVNLIANRKVVPELIQEAFTPANVASEISKLFEPKTRATTEADLLALRKSLGGGAAEHVATAALPYFSQAPQGPTP